MKKQQLMISVTKFFSGFFSLFVLSFSGVTQAGSIIGTAHDFSGSGWTGGEICVACHTPHNADNTVGDAPLWNHAVTAETFNMYAGLGSMDATSDGQPSGISKLCLSCHDGVTALDSFGGTTGTTTIGAVAANLGTDLRNDHPISILFDTALSTTDPGLHDPAATSVTIGEGGDKPRTGTIASVMLSNNRVQCSSCHDVHNGSVGVGADFEPFLKVSKAGSAICLTCHDK